MKRIVLTLALGLCAFSVKAQVYFNTDVNVNYALCDDLQWIQRYEHDIITLCQRDAQCKDFNCDILFLGSSSIRMWTSLKEDFPAYSTVNRGYGGATMRDILYNYSILFSKYQPRNIVFYCDNDIAGNEHDLGVGEWYDLYRCVFNKIHRDYPETKIYALSIKYCGRREQLRDKQCLENALLQEFCEKNDWITFVDVTTPLLKADGTPNDSLFLQDQLHINREGYSLWTKAIMAAGLK